MSFETYRVSGLVQRLGFYPSCVSARLPATLSPSTTDKTSWTKPLQCLDAPCIYIYGDSIETRCVVGAGCRERRGTPSAEACSLARGSAGLAAQRRRVGSGSVIAMRR